jgi:hypothetical protein
MRLAGERIAARKDASTWLVQSESGDNDQNDEGRTAASDTDAHCSER